MMIEIFQALGYFVQDVQLFYGAIIFLWIGVWIGSILVVSSVVGDRGTMLGFAAVA